MQQRHVTFHVCWRESSVRWPVDLDVFVPTPTPVRRIAFFIGHDRSASEGKPVHVRAPVQWHDLFEEWSSTLPAGKKAKYKDCYLKKLLPTWRQSVWTQDRRICLPERSRQIDPHISVPPLKTAVGAPRRRHSSGWPRRCPQIKAPIKAIIAAAGITPKDCAEAPSTQLGLMREAPLDDEKTKRFRSVVGSKCTTGTRLESCGHFGQLFSVGWRRRTV